MFHKYNGYKYKGLLQYIDHNQHLLDVEPYILK